MKPFYLDGHNQSLGRMRDRMRELHSVAVRAGQTRVAIYDRDYEAVVKKLKESGFVVRSEELSLAGVVFYKSGI